MACLQATVEVGISLMSFHNVDLNQQGLYRLSVSVAKGADRLRAIAQEARMQEAKEASNSKKKLGVKDSRQGLGAHADAPLEDRATPYACFETDLDLSHVEGRKVLDSLRRHTPASISGVNDVYYSKGFLVRYVDEKRNINDGVHFRFDLNAIRDRDVSLRLCICLERACPPVTEDEGPPEYSILSARTVQLNRVGEGLHEYIPIIYDDFYNSGFALLETTVHTCVTGIRYEPDTSGLRLAQYLLRGREEKDLDEALDAPFAQDLETMRRTCIFLLRSSHVSLAACIDLLIRKLDPEDKDAIGDGELCLKPLTEIELAPNLLEGDQSAHSVEKFATAFSNELETWSSALLLAWHSFLHSLQACSGKVRRDLKSAWLDKATEKVGESVIRERFDASTIKGPTDANVCRKRDEVAAKIRQCAIEIRNFQREKVEDYEMFEDDSSFPILFEQRYDTKLSTRSLVAPAANAMPPQPPMSTLSSSSSSSLVSTSGVPGEPLRKPSFASSISTPSPNLQLQQPNGEATQNVDPPSPCTPPKLKRNGGVKFADVRDVVVLVHGYMGSSWDLRPFRNYLLLIEPDVISYLSKANEEDTDTDIEVLGFRLANEVHSFLKRTFGGEDFKLGRLSFVCHSIGSVILRSALTRKEMAEFLPNLHSLLSMSSPHLGSRAMKSTLVKYGLWAMRHWRKASALGQLSMADVEYGKTIRDTLVFRLSEAEESLRHFDHIVLISSHQDHYVPYHSTRVEYLAPSSAVTKSDISLAKDMTDNLLKGVDPSKIVRLDISFQFDNLRTNRMDKFIGRAAHIKILDSPALSLTLLLHFKELFEPTFRRSE
mmetsp:Transcript_2621/g.6117  ORF Transcript_2621/g.6117 Transcript_2621/m.6117 type:complete len:829 (-) Transcript_2621:44-2530(-)